MVGRPGLCPAGWPTPPGFAGPLPAGRLQPAPSRRRGPLAQHPGPHPAATAGLRLARPHHPPHRDGVLAAPGPALQQRRRCPVPALFALPTGAPHPAPAPPARHGHGLCRPGVCPRRALLGARLQNQHPGARRQRLHPHRPGRRHAAAPLRRASGPLHPGPAPPAAPAPGGGLPPRRPPGRGALPVYARAGWHLDAAPAHPQRLARCPGRPDHRPRRGLRMKHDAPHTLDLFAPEDSALPLRDQLHAWQTQGLLRPLDIAWMQFVHTHHPSAPDCVLLASALLAHVESRGHSCLPLADLVAAPQRLLAWDSSTHPDITAQWRQLPAALDAWLQALQHCPLVRVVGRDADSGQPMVLHPHPSAPKLYLRRYWHYERAVAQHILQRCRATPDPSTATNIDPPTIRHWLDRLFPSQPSPATENTDCDWQKLACALALRGRLTLITGGPGPGKPYTAARLLALLFATAAQPDQLRVALAAPTGKAAARLKQSIDQALLGLHTSIGQDVDIAALVQRTGAARTLHSLLQLRPGQASTITPLEVDVLIVDEASMVHLAMMATLLQALPPQARLIILGDKDQLASVEAGAVLGDLCQGAEGGHYPPDTVAYARRVAGQHIPVALQDAQGSALAQRTIMLRHSHRFGGPIGELAQAVNAGDAATAQQVLAHCADDSLHASSGGALKRIWDLAVHGRGPAASYRHYAQALRARPPAGDEAAHRAWVIGVLRAFEGFRLLCAVREGDWGVEGLNSAIEKALRAQGLLPSGGEWYVGRPVMVTRNDAALGVFNGDIGITLPSVRGDALRVYFLDGAELRSVGVARLAHVETAFAMTVHKSQGSEFAHTALVLPARSGGVLGRELVYTGITRAREHFSLLTQHSALLAEALANPTRRSSGLLRFLHGEFAVH